MEEDIQLVNELSNFQSDFIFFQNELSNLRKEYLNKFVAISNKNIIGFASSMEELTKKLQRKNIDIAKTVVEFVPEKETVMIL